MSISTTKIGKKFKTFTIQRGGKQQWELSHSTAYQEWYNILKNNLALSTNTEHIYTPSDPVLFLGINSSEMCAYIQKACT